MSIPCILVEKGQRRWRPGEMWYCEAICQDGHWYCEEGGLSDDYVRNWGDKRRPLVVILPNGDTFGIDTHITGSRRGWTVTGEAPKITVTPSINIVGRWHGFLTNGILSDDCEGRTFPR